MRGIVRNLDDQLVALDHTDAKCRVEGRTALTGLAHALSHDVRAAFRSTQGFAQVVATRAADTLPQEDLQLLQRVVDASQRGSALLDEIVAWLRITQYTPKFQTVDIQFVLEWAASDVDPSALDLHITGNAETIGDEHLLKRLFEVILSNAKNFTAAGTGPAHLQVDVREDDSGVHIRVQDAGIGFDPQHASRVFEPFVRLHAAEAGGGQGLGLAIAKTIVDKHEGSISLNAADGGGSVVTIFLPKVSDRT